MKLNQLKAGALLSYVQAGCSVVITLALAFLILKEPFTSKSLIGCALITAGTLFMVL